MKKQKIIPMTQEAVGVFFARSAALLERAKQGIDMIREEYPMIEIQALSLDVGAVSADFAIGADAVADVAGRDIEDANAAVDMVKEEANDALKQYGGRIRSSSASSGWYGEIVFTAGN